MSEIPSLPKLVIAGSGSGVGKTTVVLGLATALRRKGLRVATFKCGPDYLDPTYHEKASGRACHNLDPWMMGREAVLSTFNRGCAEADIALVEGVMGLFDGLSPESNAGSTAELAEWLQAPILLTLDASGMARTFAALVEGLRRFDSSLLVRGAIANFVGSRGHLDLLRTSLASPEPLPLVGGFPKTPDHAFAERHLGLHSAREKGFSQSSLERWGDLCEEWFDLKRILEIASTSGESLSQAAVPAPIRTSPRCRIGIARDEAFHFYYDENLRLLECAGAELVPFSPLRDRELPDVQGLYFGGGYPELHAQDLSLNQNMLESIRRFAADDGFIYAECGGFMYLTDRIVTTDGQAHAMVGLISGQARMRERLQALGYVEVTTEKDTLIGPAGTRFRGHQFRYSDFETEQGRPVEQSYRVRRRRAKDVLSEGYSIRNVLASYVHGHWASHPQIASHFVDACVGRA